MMHGGRAEYEIPLETQYWQMGSFDVLCGDNGAPADMNKSLLYVPQICHD